MDFFSFLPIIIFIYAIATMFNPKNKAPKNRRQNPAPQGTWRERLEELERQWLPQEVAQNPQRRQPERTAYPSEGLGSEGYAGTEGIGTEGMSRSEGTISTEGEWGTEGTYGSEGSFGSSDTFGTEKPKSPLGPSLSPTHILKEVRAEKPKEDFPYFPKVTADSLMQGVIWAEVLGKPRARGGWSDSRRH